ncbi:hypothetical protein J3R83DRAFT_13713 [Lanmaoa asiatica]|nr:hypothetical protein J3R83DRAFT_13713 [Lanmaoa asiatica]
MTDSPRHRSSTLKPIKPPSSPQSSQFSTPRPPSPACAPPQHTTHNTPAASAPILAHLLPRHAAFTVTLTLHQLHNVPLVHGEFGLKWKIKGVTSHSGNGLLDKVKARKAKGKVCERTRSSGSATAPAPSIAKGSDTDNASLFDAASASDAHSIANSSSTHSPSNDHANSTSGSAHGHATRTQPLPIPAVVVSVNHPSPPSVARSVSGTSSIASVGSASSISSQHANGRFVPNPPGYLSADWSRQGPEHDTETLLSNGNTTHCLKMPTKPHYSPAKGITPFVKLKEHSVVWGTTLKLVVQMSVDAPRNPRLGVVYLNLAQYVDTGVITRRYLLRQSKTNATLKLTIHLEHTAGELAYVAPPLPKGEILSGVAGFLEASDIYRTRPRASDLYTHASSDSSTDDAGVASGSDTSSVVSASVASNGTPSQGHSHGHGHTDGQSRHVTVKKQRRPFEVAKLPTINDPRGTEKLIEALFNPVPVTQLGKGTRRGTAVIADREADDDGSLYTDSPDESADETNGMGSDYHSLRSHPSVQGSLRSKRSIRSLASKVGLKRDDGGEETAVSTGVHLLSGVTERRTWWQKVLSSPITG